MFEPEPVVIVSLPGPPKTIWSPEPVVIVSLPPTPTTEVWMLARTIGRLWNSGPSNGLVVIVPLSPRTMFVPVLFGVVARWIVSSPAPPTTMLLPLWVVIVSSPPTAGRIDAASAISVCVPSGETAQST